MLAFYALHGANAPGANKTIKSKSCIFVICSAGPFFLFYHHPKYIFREIRHKNLDFMVSMPVNAADTHTHNMYLYSNFFENGSIERKKNPNI